MITHALLPGSAAARAPTRGAGVHRPGSAAAALAQIVIDSMPRPSSQPWAGRGVTGTFAVAFVVRTTDALDCAGSAAAIGALDAVPLRCVAAATELQRLAMGTAGASTIAWSGVSNSAVTRGAAACFIAAAMAATGLYRRIALAVLSTVDARPAHDVIGTMVAGLGAMSRRDWLRRFRSASLVPFTLDSGVGTARLRPHAAGWRSEPTVHAPGPGQASTFAIPMLPCAFVIAAQPALASATMPGCMSHAA